MKIFFQLIITVVCFFFISSCKVSPCDKQLCKNGTYQETGSNTCACVCPTGFEGENCDQNAYAELEGQNVQTTETWKNGGQVYTYTSNLTVDLNSYYNPRLYIQPFLKNSQYGGSAPADILSKTQIAFYNSQFSMILPGAGSSEYVTFTGQGTLQGGTITVTGALEEAYYPYYFIDSIRIDYKLN